MLLDNSDLYRDSITHIAIVSHIILFSIHGTLLVTMVKQFKVSGRKQHGTLNFEL
jgi:hypothetical protein